MELRHLAYAVQVARAGSFSAAAAQLHMTQPSLSQAIAQLEADLGAPLFTRSTRGATLTATGAHVVRQAQRILRDVDDLRQSVRASVNGEAGSLVLGIAPVLAWEFAPPIMRAFAAAAPAVDFTIRERNVGEIIELMLEGAIDVGLVATASAAHLREFHRESLRVERLGAVELVAALPDRYRDSPDPIRLADIAHEQIAVPPPSARTYGLRAGLLRAFDRAALPAPRTREVPSLFEAIPLVMADLAVGIVPAGMREGISSPLVALRRIVDGPEPLDISLLYRPEPTRPVRLFIETARTSAPASGHNTAERSNG